jgi:hypothetical protein
MAEARPEVPLRLDQIAWKALAKDPEERFESCEALGEELEDLARRSGWNTSSRALAKVVGELMLETGT